MVSRITFPAQQQRFRSQTQLPSAGAAARDRRELRTAQGTEAFAVGACLAVDAALLVHILLADFALGDGVGREPAGPQQAGQAGCQQRSSSKSGRQAQPLPRENRTGSCPCPAACSRSLSARPRSCSWRRPAGTGAAAAVNSFAPRPDAGPVVSRGGQRRATPSRCPDRPLLRASSL